MQGRLVAFSLVAALFAAIVPAADAQTDTTWYLHEMTTPDGAGSYLNFTPISPDEVDNSQYPLGSTGSSKYRTSSVAQGPLASAYTAVGSEGVATVWYKTANNLPVPDVKVTITVSADGTPIATGTSAPALIMGYMEYVVPLTLSVSSLPAGATIQLDVDATSASCGCFIGLAYARGSSVEHPWFFTLPLVPDLGAGGSVTNLEGDVVELVEDIAAGTTKTLQYTWNTELSSPEIRFAATVNAGTIAIEILDGAGIVAYAKTMDASGEDTAKPQATGGEWTITVSVTEFEGSFTLDIKPAVGTGKASETQVGSTDGAGAQPKATGTGSAGKSAPTTNAQEVSGQQEAKKKSPAPAFVLVGLVLLGMAFVARRRA
jgi:hypothetical protein